MLPVERRKKIMDLLNKREVLKIDELLDELDISTVTLRRDINILAEQGLIIKIYGGIQGLKTNLINSPSDGRIVQNIEEKEQIAIKCCELIEDYDCIYLDGGSTAFQIAKHIKHFKNLTVVTNSIPIINELIDSQVDLIILGGKMSLKKRSIAAYDYLFNFSGLNIFKAFISASGITIEKGISDYNLDEVNTRKKIIDISKEVYIIADNTKFGKDVAVGIAPLEKVDYIVTDGGVRQTFIEDFQKTQVELVVANVI
ncbi:MAG: DeoR/GlpR family DNA-binding transcription regulator [Solibacillus sp.]